MGINELNALLDAAEGLGKSLAAAKAGDGKISQTEYIFAAIANGATVLRALSGVNQIVLEIKDLDATEAQALLQRSMNVWVYWAKVLGV